MGRSKPFLVNEADGTYRTLRSVSPDEIIEKARDILGRRFRRGKAIKSPNDAREFIASKIGLYEREVFGAVFLTNRHTIIRFEILFYGTIDNTTIYPREVVKRSLELNAAAVILAHNHPSGVAEPSEADRLITKRIRDALDLVDVRTLDHFVVGGADVVSFASRGYI